MQTTLAQFNETQSQEAFALQNSKLLKVRLDEVTIQAKLGSMVAYQGDVTFEHAGSGGLGRMLKKAVSGEGTSLMKVKGTGEVFLADQAQDVHLIYLENDFITVNGRNLLAFDAGMDWRQAARDIPMKEYAHWTDPERVVVRSAGMWKPFALVASLAALVFAGLWAFAPPRTVEFPVERPFQPGAISVAQINGAAEQGTLLTALYDRESGRLYLRLADLPDAQRVPELWLMDESGAPRSLGYGERGGVSELQLTTEQQAIVQAGGTIAVSLEAPAETPHEAPTEVLGTASLAPFEQG